MRTGLPTGTVTFLFTDIEGSTRLLREIGEGYGQALAEHRRILREAFTGHGGVEVDTQGDAFFVAFADASDAVAAAADAQRALRAGPMLVRMGVHTGQPSISDEGYFGADVHKGARIGAAAHGGQVVISRETRLFLGDMFELTDLGEHRVKDFDAPVWIFQLGSQRFPPLKTISNTNLPRPGSSFVGREKQVADIGGLLRDGARLLTLSGPGGTGKTRLAIEAAAELLPHFRNGVFWVDLAALRDPALVPETIAQTLGAKNGLAEHIGEREMLLVLDNLEQVVSAAPELASLVEACPNLRLLATSRERLRVRGEVEYAVPPLATREAVELFSERSQLRAADTIAELCRRLDNLPLAVELAAARTSVLSPQQILERLSKRLDLLKGGRDAEARQATLRATIGWSYDLLTEEEQTLFARLSVFRDGCTLEAAEEVADADLDVLQSLVDKSLVRHADERFSMLETIREFAAERLEASGEADKLRRRHADHFLALAEEAEPHLRGNPREWADRLGREHDNVRSGLDTLEASGEAERALRLAGAMAPFWYLRNHVVEGRRRLEAALLSYEYPTAARAKALAGVATMAFGEADLESARDRAEEALALYRELGDRWGAAYSAMVLGNAVSEVVPQVAADLARAQQLLEESVNGFREVGDVESELRAAYNLAILSGDIGQRERKRAILEDNLRRARALGLERDQSMALGGLSGFAQREGRIGEAVAMLVDSIRIERGLGDLAWAANNLGRLAEALALAGRVATAARVLGSAEALREHIGLRWPPWATQMNEETRTAIRAQLDEVAFADASEQGRGLSIDDAVALTLDSVVGEPFTLENAPESRG